MNTILENLFLRRPRIEYVSPPVCPVNFSASGSQIVIQDFNEDEFCPMYVTGTCDQFLNFAQPADALAYNVYQSQTKGGVLNVVLSGLLPGYLAVYSSGNYYFTVNTLTGESTPTGAFSAPGGVYVVAQIPAVTNTLNLYRNGQKVAVAFTGALVEAVSNGWYLATKITTDGESNINTSCGTVYVTPCPIPPIPPCPGPDWTSFQYGSALLLGGLGSTLPGTHYSVGGGFNPPGANFDVFADMTHAQASWEYIINVAGFVQGNYTGPAVNCLLTMANTIVSGPADVNNYVWIDQIITGGSWTNIARFSGFTNGTSTYPFTLLDTGGKVSAVRITLQNEAEGFQYVRLAGSFSNVC